MLNLFQRLVQKRQQATTNMSLFFLLLFLLIGFPLSGPCAFGQQVTADTIGRVTDTTGAVIPNATVKITNIGTGETRKAATNGQGEYTFNLLQIGSYKVRVESPGFKTVQIPVFALQVGERHRVDVQMQVGSQSEEIVVTTEAPALQTDTASLGQTLENQAVQDLPTQGRNLYSLVQLAPGANAGPADGVSSGNRPDDRRQASEVSANGQSDSRNNNLLDGMDNNTRTGNIIVVRPSIDAIQELSVLTNNYPAEAGNVAGAVVNMLTKSGTNAFHGTAYEYFRNDKMDGRDYFSAGTAKPELRQNQFGGSFGGPIRRNKTFFFADAEDFRKVHGSTVTTTVPTAQEQENYDFTDNNGDDLGATSGFTPDPAGLAFFKLFPTPTRSGIVNNYTASPKGTQYSFTTDARVDHHFGPNDLFFGRYSYNKVDTFTPGIFPEVNGIEPGGNIFGFEGTAHETAMNGMLDYTHIINSNLILELKTAYTRFRNEYVNLNEGTNASEKLGATNVNVDSRTTGLTGIYLMEVSSLGDSTYEPGNLVSNTFQDAAILSYSRGSHSIKTGFSLIRRQQNNNTWGNYPLGVYYFVPISGLRSSLGISDSASENLLLGLSYAADRQNNLTTQYPRFWETGAFVQDDWRVTPKLTLNLGVRYDIFTPQTDAAGRMVNFDIDTAKLITSSKNGGVDTDYKDVSPRIGFSASVTPNTVVHGAFALSFFPADTQNTLMPLDPPYSSSWGATFVSLDANNPNNPYSIFGTMQAPTSPGTDLSTFSGTIYAKAKHFPSSYMEEFNLGIQQQFGQNVISAGYVGELGHRINLAGNYDIDLPDPSTSSNYSALAPYYSTLPDVSAIYYYCGKGASNYHALQASFTRHFSHGWSMNANYTWSHSIDDIAGASYSASPYGLLPKQFSTYDRGNGDLDLRHRFAITASYDFPFTKAYTGMKKKLLNGWQLNTIAFWQAGSTYSIVNTSPQINIASTSVFTSDRPNRYANYQDAVAGLAATNTANAASGATQWTSSAIKCMGANNTGNCFAPQAFGTAGNSGKNIFTGPHQRRIDLSIFRDFRLNEWMKMQFRAESYDMTNSPNFAGPNDDISSSSWGVISASLADQRVFQFALKLSY
jgi:outer membrane receptor protein involved in Fe transport